MQHNRGFTLTEAIVSIAIIGVLTAIISISVREYRIRAEAGAVVQELATLETALRTYNQLELASGWPTVGGTGNNMPSIVAGTHASFPGFAAFISSYPENLSSYNVHYSFDGTALSTCGTDRGVHLIIQDGSGRLSELFPIMDTAIDGVEDADCGKLRLQSGALYYTVAESTFAY